MGTPEIVNTIAYGQNPFHMERLARRLECSVEDISSAQTPSNWKRRIKRTNHRSRIERYFECATPVGSLWAVTEDQPCTGISLAVDVRHPDEWYAREWGEALSMGMPQYSAYGALDEVPHDAPSSDMVDAVLAHCYTVTLMAYPPVTRPLDERHSSPNHDATDHTYATGVRWQELSEALQGGQGVCLSLDQYAQQYDQLLAIWREWCDWDDDPQAPYYTADQIRQRWAGTPYAPQYIFAAPEAIDEGAVFAILDAENRVLDIEAQSEV